MVIVEHILESRRHLVTLLEVEVRVVADLVLGSLMKQLRDTGIAAREISDLVDINDIDGPAKQIVDTMLVALEQTKRIDLYYLMSLED